MESSNEDRDAAIQRLIDLMRIPAENRLAATSSLLQLVKSFETWGRHAEPGRRKRFERISKLCDKLLKELDGLTALEKRFISEPKHTDAIGSLREILSSKTLSKRPPNRPRHSLKNIPLTGLIMQLHLVLLEYGGRRLTLTRNTVSGEASGSLPMALTVLHRMLPSIIRSSRIPYSTLNRMRSYALDPFKISDVSDNKLQKGLKIRRQTKVFKSTK